MKRKFSEIDAANQLEGCAWKSESAYSSTLIESLLSMSEIEYTVTLTLQQSTETAVKSLNIHSLRH